jgi:pyruvate-formate lyase-activating enzyme
MVTTADAIKTTRNRMQDVFTPNQVLGRTRAIGCTAVEITQRCNLDCTLCYLSERSEDVSDVPLDEIFNRLDAIRSNYGPGTNVQITGGDPTLRKHTELIDIVRHAASIGLYPALFTNGIAASRKLLTQLAQAGLREVAFHVDTTQRRAGYTNEQELNRIRTEYIGRAASSGLMVIFNTTVHAGNFDEIPALVRFFIKHADSVGFASFQLQADTGRGEWSTRSPIVSLDSVKQQISRGANRALPWDLVRIGHPRCHSYVPTLIVNGTCYPIIKSRRFIANFLNDFAYLHQDRRRPRHEILGDFLTAGLRKPIWFLRGSAFLLDHLWRAKKDLWRSRGRVHRLSFFAHNFMDADHLEPERVRACSFMLMTAEGPISMCEHNAHRDEFVLKPIAFRRRDGSLANYDPLSKPVNRQQQTVSSVEAREC